MARISQIRYEGEAGTHCPHGYYCECVTIPCTYTFATCLSNKEDDFEIDFYDERSRRMAAKQNIAGKDSTKHSIVRGYKDTKLFPDAYFLFIKNIKQAFRAASHPVFHAASYPYTPSPAILNSYTKFAPSFIYLLWRIEREPWNADIWHF